ncbi:hypothetical protein [Evansella clarkii]|uniref:hypothetical protein n=1 Tax=Evansella clarkii TaxID=79879 RepID=UPI0009982503|nr:hypothetical protein [Evansella clarkii]
MKCVYDEKLFWLEGTPLEIQLRELFLYKTGFNIDRLIEAITEAAAVVREIVEKAVSAFRQAFAVIEEVVEKVETDKQVKATWHVPRKLNMHSQVIDRRPKFVHIRNRL